MDWALLALSAALVLTTVIYAVYTAKMSAEMRSTRLLSIRPRLALDVDVLAVHGILTITNVGQGAALGVDVALSFEPGGEQRPWQAFSLLPGEQARFKPAPVVPGNVELPSLAQLQEAKASVHLSGSMKDSEGNVHAVDELLAFEPWWTAVGESGQLASSEPAENIARELEKIRKTLEKR
jgi:hypothetical protein